jgi:hypothetical protein
MSKDMKPTRRAMLASAAATVPLATTTPAAANTAFVSRLSGLNQLVSRATAQATVIGFSVTAIQTQGYATPGDGGGAIYTKTGGSTTGGFQSADGAWWQLSVLIANVLMFGADRTGTLDSTTAINNAISAVSNGSYGTLFFPAGTYLVSNTITVPTHTALVGAGKRATYINATNTFPNATPMFVMGSSSITFDVKITDMFISPNQANGSGSIGIYATQLQEGCALLRVGVGGSRDTGIHLRHCSHIYCEDVEIGSNSLSANYGMYIDSCDIILNRLSLTSQSPVGVLLTSTYIVGSGWNLEGATDGVRVTSTEGVLSNVSNGSSGTNHVHFTDSSGLVLIALQNPFYSVTIQDDYTKTTITDSYVPFWSGQARVNATQTVIAASPYNVSPLDLVLIGNNSGSIGLILPNPYANYTGRFLYVKNTTAQSMKSINSDVVPLIGGAAQQAILGPIVGAWAVLFCDGVHWNIISGYNPTSQYTIVSAASYTVGPCDVALSCQFSGTMTLTLPNPATNPGRVLYIRTIGNNAVNSASSNVDNLTGAVGSTILAATAGKFATLVSDGSTNWRTMAAN